MSMDGDIETDIARIKVHAESLDMFCTERVDSPESGLEKMLGRLLQGQAGYIIREAKKETVAFGWLFFCNLALLALILWRVW